MQNITATQIELKGGHYVTVRRTMLDDGRAEVRVLYQRGPLAKHLSESQGLLYRIVKSVVHPTDGTIPRGHLERLIAEALVDDGYKVTDTEIVEDSMSSGLALISIRLKYIRLPAGRILSNGPWVFDLDPVDVVMQIVQVDDTSECIKIEIDAEHEGNENVLFSLESYLKCKQNRQSIELIEVHSYYPMLSTLERVLDVRYISPVVSDWSVDRTDDTVTITIKITSDGVKSDPVDAITDRLYMELDVDHMDVHIESEEVSDLTTMITNYLLNGTHYRYDRSVPMPYLDGLWLDIDHLLSLRGARVDKVVPFMTDGDTKVILRATFKTEEVPMSIHDRMDLLSTGVDKMMLDVDHRLKQYAEDLLTHGLDVMIESTTGGRQPITKVTWTFEQDDMVEVISNCMMSAIADHPRPPVTLEVTIAPGRQTRNYVITMDLLTGDVGSFPVYTYVVECNWGKLNRQHVSGQTIDDTNTFKPPSQRRDR